MVAKTHKYLCIDLEMSGSIPGIHDIIQIGAVLLDDSFNEISRFESLIYPKNEADFDPGSQRVHGISRFELDNAPNMDEVLDDMEYWIEEEGDFTSRLAMKDLKICGQGINNDISFLKLAYNSVNLSWPFAYQFLDLQDMVFLYSQILISNDIKPITRYNLDSIASFFKLKRDKRKHDALEDALLTGKCLAELIARVRDIKMLKEDNS